MLFFNKPAKLIDKHQRLITNSIKSPMNNNIYICGHRSPDLDSIASAIAYADLKNRLDSDNHYQPMAAGPINQETAWTLEHFGFPQPASWPNDLSPDQALILVDHNEVEQMPFGYVNCNIIGIIDHHKINFHSNEPIEIIMKPLGSTCSIIYELFQNNNLEISPNLSGLMLSAILTDTLITKSPTCTATDRSIIEKLATAANIKNWSEFGLNLFEQKGTTEQLTTEQILNGDRKDFQFGDKKISVAQLETTNLENFKQQGQNLKKALAELRENHNYHTTILLITDIIKVGSWLLVDSAEPQLIEQALETKLPNGENYQPGLVSRKKQIIPPLNKIFN